jgi:hypothetical protein
MSKNSPKQNYLALKEWLHFMKIKPKKRPVENNTYDQYHDK